VQAAPVRPVGAKQGVLKQKVGILNSWKDRRVRVLNSHLTICRVAPGQLVQAAEGDVFSEGGVVQEVDLKGCAVVSKEYARQPFVLEIAPANSRTRISLAAASVSERQAWIECILLASRGPSHAALPPGLVHTVNTSGAPGATLGGVGVVLYQDQPGQPVWIQDTKARSPAQRSGVVGKGQQVVKVDGLGVTAGYFVKAVAQLISGPVGTPVTLTIYDPARDPSQNTFSVRLVRS